LALLLSISVLLNIFLSSQVVILKKNVRGGAAEATLGVGTLAPPIDVKGLGGEPFSFGYQGNGLPTILYVFSPRCLWCARNLENAKALAGRTSDRYRFIALSLQDEDLPAYVSAHDINFPVYRGVSDQTRADYFLGRTPQTIVVSADGHVQKNWTGAYDADIARQVEEYFQITLPGLSPPQKQARPQRSWK
jgi:hypothetical protein